MAFRSDGGSLVAGIRIGALIREKKFATVIPDGAACASACALAWLGGARRFIGQGASVGFHAAYVLKSNGPAESGSGNAVMGAYLNQLGFSENAILYITKTAPTSIQWMTLRRCYFVRDCGCAVAAAGRRIPTLRSIAEQPEREPGAPRQRNRALAGRAFVGAERRSDAVSRRACMRRRLSTTASRRRGRRSCSTSAGSPTAGPSVTTPYGRARSRRRAPGTGTTCRVKGVMSWKLHDAKTTSRSRGVEKSNTGSSLAGDAPQIVAEARSAHEPVGCSGPPEEGAAGLAAAVRQSLEAREKIGARRCGA